MMQIEVEALTVFFSLSVCVTVFVTVTVTVSVTVFCYYHCYCWRDCFCHFHCQDWCDCFFHGQSVVTVFVSVTVGVSRFFLALTVTFAVSLSLLLSLSLFEQPISGVQLVKRGVIWYSARQKRESEKTKEDLSRMRPDPAFACSRSAAHIALFSILLEQETFQVFLTQFYRHKHQFHFYSHCIRELFP